MPLELLFPVPIPEEGVLLGVLVTEPLLFEPLVLLLPEPVLPELLEPLLLEGELGVVTLLVLVLEEEPLLLPVEEDVFPVAPVAELSELVLVLELVDVPVAAPWL